jgi:hypothetical protein
MMVEDEFGGRRMNDLRTVVWLNMIDSVGVPLWFVYQHIFMAPTISTYGMKRFFLFCRYLMEFSDCVFQIDLT